MTTYRKVNLEIKRASGYGNYTISAIYKGKLIETYTNNSEAFDWLNDDSNKELHHEAKQYCYSKIVAAYNSLKL